MQAALDASGAVTAIGPAVPAQPGWTIHDISDATAAAVTAALGTVTGDGAVLLGSDLTTVSVRPPSASWLASSTGLADTHRRALQGIRAALTADPAATQGDIAAIQAMVAALQAGTAPSQAQLLHLLRFLLRAVAVAA